MKETYRLIMHAWWGDCDTEEDTTEVVWQKKYQPDKLEAKVVAEMSRWTELYIDDIDSVVEFRLEKLDLYGQWVPQPTPKLGHRSIYLPGRRRARRGYFITGYTKPAARHASQTPQTARS